LDTGNTTRWVVGFGHTKIKNKNIFSLLQSSVADPDPRVFGPPGSESGSINQRYGSGSGSGFFNEYAKIVRKTLISIV
jgi:hypothetical protein